MKKVRLFLVMSILTLVVFSSCEKTEQLSLDTQAILGTYKGTLTPETGLKSTNDGSFDGTMDVTDAGNGQIEVHCYGGDIDTTFMLDYYPNGDSTMVCLTGDAFEQMYGHMKENMNNGGMMGSSDMMGGQSWTDHMNSEHQEGDEHFGGFDMTNMTFDYTMQTGNGDIRFQGKKTE
ncbi:MAG: hypothetical protein L3J74_06650 [Bacteroidales bacterium]|nr:hypothetical protein [Bacteroidales bacterium]